MKKILLGIVIGLSIAGVSYAAEILTSADSISYNDDKTVSDALNDLLGKADATAEDILNGKTAYVNGELITGTALSYQDAYDEGYNNGYGNGSLKLLGSSATQNSVSGTVPAGTIFIVGVCTSYEYYGYTPPLYETIESVNSYAVNSGSAIAYATFSYNKTNGTYTGKSNMGWGGTVRIDFYGLE